MVQIGPSHSTRIPSPFVQMIDTIHMFSCQLEKPLPPLQKVVSVLSGTHDNLIMCRSPVEPRQKLPGLERHDGGFIVLPCEHAYILERVEPHDRDELDAILYVSTKQMDAPVPPDPSLGDSSEDLRSQQLFVGVRVLGGCPSVPESADHRRNLRWRSLAAVRDHEPGRSRRSR